MCVGFRGRGHGVSGSLWVWAWVRFYRIEHTQKQKKKKIQHTRVFSGFSFTTLRQHCHGLFGFWVLFFIYFFFVQPGIPNTENKIYYSGNLI